MIVGDQKCATFVATSALALGFVSACSGAARAVEPPAAGPPVAVTIVERDRELRLSTFARTVGAVLEESDERPVAGDYISSALDAPLVDGMRVVYRPAVPVDLRVRGVSHAVTSSAATVGELLADQGVELGAGDDVTPSATQPLAAHQTVHVVRVSRWVAHVHQTIAPTVTKRSDTHLALGMSHVLQGLPGLRDSLVSFMKRDDEAPVRTVLDSHIVREARPKVIVRGSGAYGSLAHVAEQGFTSALHFAGSALHMIATAYTAGCYGCTGMTASGLRAGFGIIAVDPSVIPLGTKLFIPGYGRAVAGDTGGAIHGHRIDLGFNSNGQAMQWGNRSVTVYLLR